MTGNKLQRIIWYNYVFYLADQPYLNNEIYSPTYKIREFQYAFENIQYTIHSRKESDLG